LRFLIPYVSSYWFQANFIYTSFKFNACMLKPHGFVLATALHPLLCCDMAFAIAAIPALPEPNRMRRLMQGRVL
jgi:hypothetical protein